MGRLLRVPVPVSVAGLDLTTVPTAVVARAGSQRTVWTVPVAVALAVGGIAGIGAWAARADLPPGPAQIILRPAPPGSTQALCRAPVLDRLADARPVFLSANGSLWSARGQVVLCTIDAGQVSVLRTASATLDGRAVALTVVRTGTGPSVPHRRYVAAGLAPPDVRGISWRFPDGQRVVARLGDDGRGGRWWLVDYAPMRGVLTDLRVPLVTLAPARVTVFRTDGPVTTLRPPWPARASAPGLATGAP